MYDAVYARQSVEKVDSISVESQIEYCRYETRGNAFKEYIDKGYSGKDINRPAFEEMLEDIKSGKISRVIVYKLDRISRSILDFANMMEVFQKYKVEFISSTEKFDTSTPIGRAMLSICIVFAQLERETIQKRVSDAYYSRSKRGFYMGGRVPYGYKIVETAIDGVKTSMYEEVPEESEQIKLMYAMYANGGNSLGDIVAYFNKYGIKQLRGGMWSTARLSEMLRNPIYVQADADVYEFFRNQGANILNPVSDFIGKNSCYLYKGTVSDTRKTSDLTDKEIVLAPHNGFISSSDWLKCRIRCLNNRQSARCHKPKNSWLIGKIKCGNCGYSLTIAKSKTKWGRYFICGTKTATKGERCNGTGGTIYADLLEEYILNAILEKLSEFKILSSKNEKQNINPKINNNKIRIFQIDSEINNLLLKVTDANQILMKYINEKIIELDNERKYLDNENLLLTHINQDLVQITNHAKKWGSASFEDKQIVVDTFINVIHIANGDIKISWKI